MKEREQGDQMSLFEIAQKCGPRRFYVKINRYTTFTLEKSSP
jgi:hypothetical protein